MDDREFGRRVRAVRLRLGWRQEDVATKADVGRTTVLRIEHGNLDALQVRTLRSVLGALEIDLSLLARWRGGDLDRLLDEGHATLVGVTAMVLEAAGWIVRPEVSFSVYGERGSIDLLAWHPPTRTLLVVEVKTSLNSVEETLRRIDVKVRLAAQVARDRYGWDATATASLLAMPDDATTRRRVRRHDRVLDRAFPVQGREARSWLRAPAGATGLILFLTDVPRAGRIQRIAPVRRVRARVSQCQWPCESPRWWP